MEDTSALGPRSSGLDHRIAQTTKIAFDLPELT